LKRPQEHLAGAQDVGGAKPHKRVQDDDVKEAAVVTHDLRVTRGRREVLGGLSLTVAAHTVTGLLGPSGSGKTTLMRAIVGVQQVKGGDVSVLGAPAGTATLRPRVSYVTQAPSVYGDLTVAENLSYFTHIVGAEPRRVDAVLTDVGLAGHRSQLVGDLSGGERARVSLATALLNQPRLLVLDEPTVGLDPVLRRDLWALFHRLAAAGTTLLVSSHVMDEAAHCDELILLRDGRVLYTGTPQRLLEVTGTDELNAAFLALVEGAS
jgi:ABC-type multidrug transport system ATPase subunit